MKPWNGSEIRPKHFREPRLKVLARRLRDWLDRFLDEGETGVASLRQPSVARGYSSASSAISSASEPADEVTRVNEDHWRALQNAGPPEDWLRKVREGAPHLLQTANARTPSIGAPPPTQ